MCVCMYVFIYYYFVCVCVLNKYDTIEIDVECSPLLPNLFIFPVLGFMYTRNICTTCLCTYMCGNKLHDLNNFSLNLFVFHPTQRNMI